jgi:hypothetical protein
VKQGPRFGAASPTVELERIADALERIAKALEKQMTILLSLTGAASRYAQSDSSIAPRYLRVSESGDEG